MTTTPPPDDQPPPPAAQPQAPPPAPPMAAPQYAVPPADAALPTRPGMVTAAGILMIIFGAFLCLFGVLLLIGGAVVGGGGFDIESQMPGMGITAGAVAGVIIVFALIFLALGILDIVAGANVFGGRGWARITGIVLAAIFAVFSLLSIGGGGRNGLLITLLVIVGNGFIVWALGTTGTWFAARTR